MEGFPEEVMHKLSLEEGVGVCYPGWAKPSRKEKHHVQGMSVSDHQPWGLPSLRCSNQERDREGRSQVRRTGGRKESFSMSHWVMLS